MSQTWAPGAKQTKALEKHEHQVLKPRSLNLQASHQAGVKERISKFIEKWMKMKGSSSSSALTVKDAVFASWRRRAFICDRARARIDVIVQKKMIR
jgi:hypothetical protein